MPARKLDRDDFRKYSSKETYSDYIKVRPVGNVKTGKNSSRRSKPKAKKNNVSVILFIFIVFTMTMVITYRYNIISEKNLESQNLQSELNKAKSNLVAAQIEVEQQTDLNEIEAYAKQQLGMQKPDKNQTIYVDTSKNTVSNASTNSNSSIENIINKVKDFIAKIF